jgi:hypothetical protein
LLLTTERSGDFVRASSWTRICNTTWRDADVGGLRFHDLCHLAGTLKEIQSRLGRASHEAAMIYRHVPQGRDGVVA